MTLPIGTIVAYAGEIDTTAKGRLASQGWLVCDGEDYSIRDYVDLNEIIGNFYGTSKQAGKGKLPDLRGRFLRGVDHGVGQDPDAGSRKASGDGGNSGDKVGSVQDDAIQVHSHNDSGHAHKSYHMASQSQGLSNGEEYSGWSEHKNHKENEVGHAQLGGPTKFENQPDPRSGEETRPKNIYVNWIIKAKNVNG